MKPRYIIIIITSIFICTYSASSQSLSSKEKRSISQQTDSILNLYMKYATFTVDGSSISNTYIDGFKNLFSSPRVVVLNDLDPTDRSPKEVSVSAYVDYVKKWYPTGLSIDLSDVSKGTPRRTGGGIEIEVDVKKDLLGFYMDRERYSKVYNLKFFLFFNKEGSQAKIRRIGNLEIAKDSLDYRSFKREADKYFDNSQFEKAKSFYLKALLVFPNNTYSTNQITKCNNRIEKIKFEKRKPLYLIVELHPTFSSVLVKSYGNVNPEVKSGFGFGGGIGFEMDLFSNKSKSVNGGFGVGISIISVKPKMQMQSFNDSISNHIDIDNDTCIMLVRLQNIDEQLKLTYLDIPVYFQMKFGMGKNKKVYVNLKLGVKIGLAMSSKFNSTAEGDYRGQYPKYNGIILYGNELKQYGYGSYSVSANNAKTQSISSMNLSLLGAVGIGFRLSDKVSIFGNIDYAYGLSNLFSSTDDGSHLSANNNDLQSIGGLLQGNSSVVGIELGINLRIY